VSPLSVVSLFTGAGGLDLGFEAAGFETRVAVEMDADAVATLRHNREWPVIAADIHSELAASARILKTARLRVEQADVLIGGPPCQPFSKSGYWARGDARRLADPRAGTLGEYLRVLRDLKPKAFLLENVPGLAFSQKDEGLVFLQRSIDEINRETGLHYSFKSDVLSATQFGVPQERQRVFIVGHRDGVEFKFPEASHYTKDPDLFSSSTSVRPCPNAWDAIGDLEGEDDPSLRMTGKWADLLPTIPEGFNYLWHTERGGGSPLFGWRTRYWSFLLKLSKAAPSWTIAAQPGPAIGPFHWKSRRLSAREMARLQTFPDRYEILGNLRAAQKQLGNAVPSALAERLALSIREQFFGDRKRRDPTLIPTPRPNIPPEEKVQSRLPKKYEDMIGEYAAHPGTGLGPGARARRATA
jgi:DNA (cytosine-5)-methyltransferase 1